MEKKESRVNESLENAAVSVNDTNRSIEVSDLDTLEDKILLPDLFLEREESIGKNKRVYYNYMIRGKFNGGPIHADFGIFKRETRVVSNRMATLNNGDVAGYDTLLTLFGSKDKLPIYIKVSQYTTDTGEVRTNISYYVACVDDGVALCVRITPVTEPSIQVASMLIRKSIKKNNLVVPYISA